LGPEVMGGCGWAFDQEKKYPEGRGRVTGAAPVLRKRGERGHLWEVWFDSRRGARKGKRVEEESPLVPRKIKRESRGKGCRGVPKSLGSKERKTDGFPKDQPHKKTKRP